jgi:hypothetical protein
VCGGLSDRSGQHSLSKLPLLGGGKCGYERIVAEREGNQSLHRVKKTPRF